MAPLGVRKTEELVAIARRIAALELTVAARALELRGRPRLGTGTQAAYDLVSRYATTEPEEHWPDLDGLTAAIASGRLIAHVASEIGLLEPVSTPGDAVGPE